MKKVKYTGQGICPVRHDDKPLNGVNELPDALADYLAGRGDFELVKPKKKSTKKDEAE